MTALEAKNPLMPVSELSVKFRGKAPSQAERLTQVGQFRISNAIARPNLPDLFYITELGPGLFAGELHEICLEVGDATKIALRQQAATRVLRNPLPNVASMRTEVIVGSQSSLEMLAQPIICFQGSRLHSEVEFQLTDDSELTFAEVVGVRVGFDAEISLGNTFRTKDELIFVDQLEVSQNPLYGLDDTWLEVMGGSGSYGALYHFSNNFAHHKALVELATSTSSSALEHFDLYTVSPREDFTILRAHAAHAEALVELFEDAAAALQTVG